MLNKSKDATVLEIVVGPTGIYASPSARVDVVRPIADGRVTIPVPHRIKSKTSPKDDNR